MQSFIYKKISVNSKKMKVELEANKSIIPIEVLPSMVTQNKNYTFLHYKNPNLEYTHEIFLKELNDDFIVEALAEIHKTDKNNIILV